MIPLLGGHGIDVLRNVPGTSLGRLRKLSQPDQDGRHDYDAAAPGAGNATHQHPALLRCMWVGRHPCQQPQWVRLEVKECTTEQPWISNLHASFNSARWETCCCFGKSSQRSPESPWHEPFQEQPSMADNIIHR